MRGRRVFLARTRRATMHMHEIGQRPLHHVAQMATKLLASGARHRGTRDALGGCPFQEKFQMGIGIEELNY